MKKYIMLRQISWMLIILFLSLNFAQANVVMSCSDIISKQTVVMVVINEDTSSVELKKFAEGKQLPINPSKGIPTDINVLKNQEDFTILSLGRIRLFGTEKNRWILKYEDEDPSKSFYRWRFTGIIAKKVYNEELLNCSYSITTPDRLPVATKRFAIKDIQPLRKKGITVRQFALKNSSPKSINISSNSVPSFDYTNQCEPGLRKQSVCRAMNEKNPLVIARIKEVFSPYSYFTLCEFKDGKLNKNKFITYEISFKKLADQTLVTTALSGYYGMLNGSTEASPTSGGNGAEFTLQTVMPDGNEVWSFSGNALEQNFDKEPFICSKEIFPWQENIEEFNKLMEDGVWTDIHDNDAKTGINAPEHKKPS